MITGNLRQTPCRHKTLEPSGSQGVGPGIDPHGNPRVGPWIDPGG